MLWGGFEPKSSVRASEDSSCLRPRGHCDPQILIALTIHVTRIKRLPTGRKTGLRLPTLRYKDVWGSEGKFLRIVNFGTRWRSWRSFCVTPWKNPENTYCIWIYVDPKDALAAVTETNLPPCREHNSGRSTSHCARWAIPVLTPRSWIFLRD
jgi:hypothetical protein